MSKVRFELNRAGVREMLRSNGAMSVCQSKATEVRSRVGDGYEITTYVGRNRVNASVHAATFEARKDNSDHNTLLKALGGGQ